MGVPITAPADTWVAVPGCSALSHDNLGRDNEDPPYFDWRDRSVNEPNQVGFIHEHRHVHNWSEITTMQDPHRKWVCIKADCREQWIEGHEWVLYSRSGDADAVRQEVYRCPCGETDTRTVESQEDPEIISEAEWLGRPKPREQYNAEDGLLQWWMDEAHTTACAVVPKAIEYGANSMTELGRAMGLASGREYTEAEAQEVACFFYIYGKMGRWLDAVVGGYRVGDDTIHDIEVYAKMVKRIRSAGSWPGEDLT